MAQPYEKTSLKLSKRRIFFSNFLGGFAWALGATVGLAIIFAILTLISKSVNLVPVVGSFVSEIVDFVLNTNQNFRK